MERSGREECREKLAALPSPRALCALFVRIGGPRPPGAQRQRSTFRGRGNFPDGGLNGPARDLRDERHAGMVTASMNSRRRSGIAFPATEFTASDDGLAGVTATRKPPTNRPSTAPRACPKPPLRAVDGIAAPMKLAPLRHCSRRQRDQSDRLRTPIGAGDAGRMAFQPALGSRGQRRILLSRPRHHRVRRGASWSALLDRHPPAERALAPGIEAEGRNAEGGSVHESPARGACPRAGATSSGTLLTLFRLPREGLL